MYHYQAIKNTLAQGTLVPIIVKAYIYVLMYLTGVSRKQGVQRYTLEVKSVEVETQDDMEKSKRVISLTRPTQKNFK